MVKRRIRRLILVVAIASVVAAAAIVLGIARSNGKEASRCTDCQARFLNVTVRRNVSYETYLRLSGAGAAGVGRSTLRRNGVLVRFVLETKGRGTFPLSLTLLAANGNTVSVQAADPLVSSRDSGVQTVTQWIPVPKLSGRYHIQIRVFAPGSLTDTPLDIATTTPFPVEGQPPGSSRIQVTFTVGGLGTGSGVVEGPGINCGAICSSQFAYGRTITLTAVPDPGSAFGGWNNACRGVNSTSCTLAVGPTTSVAASFTGHTVAAQLSLRTSGSGPDHSQPRRHQLWRRLLELRRTDHRHPQGRRRPGLCLRRLARRLRRNHGRQLHTHNQRQYKRHRSLRPPAELEALPSVAQAANQLGHVTSSLGTLPFIAVAG